MTSILRLSRIRPRQLYSKNVRRTLTTLPKEDIYDITIVGGGPAGLALTTALRSSPITRPLRIALVDAQPTLTSTLSWKGAERPEAEPYSNRVVSLTPRVVQFLTDIGAWAHVKRERVCAYTGMKVWDAGSGGVVEFDGREGSGVGGGVGFMTENVNLMYGLVRRIEEVAAEEEREVGEKKKGCLTVFEGTKVVGIEVEAEAAREPGTVVDNQVPQIGHWPTLRLEVPQAKDSLTSSSAPAHKHIQTRLLIGADGANSPVRKFAEIEARGWDYDRVGLVATLEIEDSQQSLSNNNNNNNTNKIAYQRFLTTGPIAILPLPGNRASLVWSTTPAYAKILKSLPANTFTALLNAALVLPQIDIDYYLTTYIPTLLHTSTSTTTLHDTLTQDIDWRLSTLASPSPSPSILPFPPPTPPPTPPKITSTLSPHPPQSFPLKLSHVTTYLSPPHRALLLGDAAHTIHPLAGLGLNLGLLDAQAVVRVLEHAVAHGMDVGDQLALEAYPAERYVENERVMGVVDGLGKVFQVGGGVGGWVRGWGMGVVQRAEGVKGWLVGRM